MGQSGDDKKCDPTTKAKLKIIHALCGEVGHGSCNTDKNPRYVDHK